MNSTLVPFPSPEAHGQTRLPQTPEAALTQLRRMLPGLSPALRKAGAYLVGHTEEIALVSARQMARAADVTPNALVRLARTLGFPGYEQFQALFRDALKDRNAQSFPDRAEWLQSLSRGGALPGLYGGMAAGAIANIEQLFQDTGAEQLMACARAILAARRTFVLGVGIANAVAQNFAYTAAMTGAEVTALPYQGATPVDSLLNAGPQDVVIAMTFRPFRSEVVDAVAVARGQGAQIIALSDCWSAPVMEGAAHRFQVPTAGPQFFTSTIALTAFFETLMAFVIAEAGEDVVARIEKFHRRRHQAGIYCEEG